MSAVLLYRLLGIWLTVKIPLQWSRHTGPFYVIMACRMILSLSRFRTFLPPGSMGHGPDITTNCMTQYHTEDSRRSFMCAFSKMLVKQKGRMRVYACTLVDDDAEYDLGDDLAAALEQKISMRHHRCFSCFKYGSSCSET